MSSENQDIEVLYIDPAILGINKPSGLRTIPDGYNQSLPCLKDMLATAYGRVWTVHRLDKETSGVVLFARNALAHRALNAQFQMHQVKKEYAAIVRGVPEWDEKEINIPLLKNGDRSHRTIPDEARGKAAITWVKVARRFGNHAYVTIQIQSGITHQIRAHLSSLGYPIPGDKLYGEKKSVSFDIEQYHSATDHFYLHAHFLDFTHPTSYARCHIEALLPSYFLRAIKTL